MLFASLAFGQDTTKVLGTTITSNCLPPSYIKMTVSSTRPNWDYSYHEYYYPMPDIYYPEYQHAIKAKGKQNSNDQKIGKWTYYHANGKRAGIAFFNKAGQKTGKWKYFSPYGKLEKIILIKKDEEAIQILKGISKTTIQFNEVQEPDGDESVAPYFENEFK